MPGSCPELVLFDFDGVLAHYSHAARIDHLARASGASEARVQQVLFDSGLEAEYDGGLIGTGEYLDRLGAGLGAPIDRATWIASRISGSQANEQVCTQVLGLATHTPVGVLTNNGALMADAIGRICAPLAALLESRVLCSGALRLRKPDPAIFRQALKHFGAQAQSTLFVDDLFVNVQGARAAGLHAETVTNARSLRRVLRRFGLQ